MIMSEPRTYPRTNNLAWIIPLLIILLGGIFSGGEPEIILLSVFVGGFIFFVISFSSRENFSHMEEERIKDLEELVYRLKDDVIELKRVQDSK